MSLDDDNVTDVDREAAKALLEALAPMMARDEAVEIAARAIAAGRTR